MRNTLWYRRPARLSSLGVPVTAAFYDDDHVPALPHEYQFHLDFEDAQTALDSKVAFLKSVTQQPHMFDQLLSQA